MNCFYHPDETAVAACMDCGKSLCQACASKYQIAICDDCNLKRNTTDKAKAVKNFFPSLVLFILGFIAMFALMSDYPISSKIGYGIIGGWGFGGTVWGWFVTRSWFGPKVVQAERTQTGLFGANVFFSAARFVIRIFVSVVVGLFVMPVELIKLILAFARAKKVTNTVNANKEEKTDQRT